MFESNSQLTISCKYKQFNCELSLKINVWKQFTTMSIGLVAAADCELSLKINVWKQFTTIKPDAEGNTILRIIT